MPAEGHDPLRRRARATRRCTWGCTRGSTRISTHGALLQCARILASIEIATAGGWERRTAQELLAEHPRLLVVGAQGSGKSALVADLALRVHGPPGEPTPDDRITFVVPVELRQPGERLDEALLARLSPAAGPEIVRRALAERRALVIVDGLDAALDGPSLLVESIPAFARAHPGNLFLVTTRPLRTGVAGQRRTELPGFVTAFMLPPLTGSRVYSGLSLPRPAHPAAEGDPLPGAGGHAPPRVGAGGAASGVAAGPHRAGRPARGLRLGRPVDAPGPDLRDPGRPPGGGDRPRAQPPEGRRPPRGAARRG